MKKIILFVSCIITGVLTNAQSPAFEWAKNTGGYHGTVIGKSISTDISGNIYTTGNFQGTPDFDPGPGTFNLTSAGNYDIFISKTDASGNFVWAKQLGGILSEDATSITVDASGNVYTTGQFQATADFDPGAGTFNLTSAGSGDIFISKLNTSGNFVWAKKIGGTNLDVANFIVSDASGNIYTTGSCSGTVDFDPGAGVFNLTGSMFISKLDGSGNFVLARAFSGAVGSAIALDASGNIHTTGYFNGTVDFDPGAGIANLISAGGSIDIFVSKLNASGNFVWAKQLGGTSQDWGFSITSDASGNIYTTGYFNGTADFDPDASGTFNFTSAGASDIFISKLNASGNFVWAKQMGGMENDIGYSIDTDASGNVYTTGQFQETADFDPDVSGTLNLISFGFSSDIFVSKLDVSGNFVWAKQMGGNSSDYGYSITLNGSGNVYTTGYFYETADFDPGAATFNLTVPDNDFGIFITKLNVSGNFIWAKNMGEYAGTQGTSIAVDLAGNVYTTGYFFGTVDFDPDASGTFNLTSDTTDTWGNIFISKLDASGNFLWAKQMSGGTLNSQGLAIATDGSGNVYTTGYFHGTVDFDPGTGTFNLTANGYDMFISKLNPSGNFAWAKHLGGASYVYGNSITLDASGNIYTTGFFNGTADFDPGAGTFNLASAGEDIFISKLNASGNFVWVKSMGGASHDAGASIALDPSGNIYTTGYFNGTADFDPGAGTFNLTSAGYNEIFVSKLNSSGNFVWAKNIGGTDDDKGKSIASDAAGNVYITGYFSGTADFDPDVSGTYNLASAGIEDIFISKLNASGDFAWAKQIGGISLDNGNSVKADASGNIYTTGFFLGTVDFDPGAATFNLIGGGGNDIFILKLNASGNFVWAKNMGANLIDRGLSLALDTHENIYTMGYFYNTVDFDPGTGTSYLTALGSPDIFVHKMSQCTPPSAVITANGPTTFCSGGSVVLNAVFAANRTYQWKKNGADISGATLSNYTAATGGTYKVTVTNTVTGCSKTSAAGTKVTVNSKPAATITAQGPTTFCAGGSVVLSANTGTGLAYKWKKNNNLISGATLSNYTATTAGTYRVEVTNSNGCSKLSAGITVTVPCKEGETALSENDFDLKVFPNPNSGEFTITFSQEPSSPVQIELTDELGKVVKRFETDEAAIVVKETNLAKGIYCLTVRNNNEEVKKKISVIK